MHGLVHLPWELVPAGKMGDILRGLLRRGHYVALVSTTVDALVEETEVLRSAALFGRGAWGSARMILDAVLVRPLGREGGYSFFISKLDVHVELFPCLNYVASCVHFFFH